MYHTTVKNSWRLNRANKKCYSLKKLLNTVPDETKENARLFVAKFNENVRLNRLLMKLPIDAVLFLSKQELGFRGHAEKVSSLNRGNFI